MRSRLLFFFFFFVLANWINWFGAKLEIFFAVVVYQLNRTEIYDWNLYDMRACRACVFANAFQIWWNKWWSFRFIAPICKALKYYGIRIVVLFYFIKWLLIFSPLLLIKNPKIYGSIWYSIVCMYVCLFLVCLRESGRNQHTHTDTHRKPKWAWRRNTHTHTRSVFDELVHYFNRLQFMRNL